MCHRQDGQSHRRYEEVLGEAQGLTSVRGAWNGDTRRKRSERRNMNSGVTDHMEGEMEGEQDDGCGAGGRQCLMKRRGQSWGRAGRAGQSKAG